MTLPRLVCFSVFAAIAAASSPAGAQLHWDASAHVGVMKRFLSDRPAGATGDAGFGPVGVLTGHVALLPLVKVGGWFAHDISPLPDAPGGDPSARNITSGGLRAKGMIPWVTGRARAWVFVGFGYAGVYQQSYPTTFAIAQGLSPPAPTAVRVEGAGGGFFDLPFGIGASYTFRKPWAVSAELGGRAGFGHSGSVYEAPGPQVSVPGFAGQNAAPEGSDRFALGLTIGITLDN